MEKMIAEMAQMNLQKIVHHVKKKEISNVKIGDAFQNVGCVISRMIAATTQMNKKICAQIKGIESARSLSSDVITPNVFQLVGSVIMTMIVGMVRMNENAPIILVLMKDSNAK